MEDIESYSRNTRRSGVNREGSRCNKTLHQKVSSITFIKPTRLRPNALDASLTQKIHAFACSLQSKVKDPLVSTPHLFLNKHQLELLDMLKGLVFFFLCGSDSLKGGL